MQDNNFIRCFSDCLFVCSPYVPEQVLVGTEGGGLHIHQPNSGVIEVGTAVNIGVCDSCMFGAHPRQLYWLQGSKLCSTDLRTAEVFWMPIVRECYNALLLAASMFSVSTSV